MQKVSCIVYCIVICLHISTWTSWFGIGSIATRLGIQLVIGLRTYSITVRFACKIDVHNCGWEDLIELIYSFGLAKSTSVNFIRVCNHFMVYGFMHPFFYVLWLTCLLLLDLVESLMIRLPNNISDLYFFATKGSS
jgi:hypothetical protein